MKDSWATNFKSEMKRIATLRKTLSDDSNDEHLVREIDESRERWRDSPRYKEIIEKVRKWRSDNDKAIGVEGPSSTDVISKYILEKDVSVPVIQFKDCQGVMLPDDKKHLRGKFPNQKTTIAELLANSKPKANLLYEDYNQDRDHRYINYFHIPSNNMTVCALLHFLGICSHLRPDWY